MTTGIKACLGEYHPKLREGRVIAHPERQEVSIKPCDRGSPFDVPGAEFPTLRLRFHLKLP